jgi:hypothetical protein
MRTFNAHEFLERWRKAAPVFVEQQLTAFVERQQLGTVRRTKPVRARPSGGLRTKAEAAAKLGCSTKTLDGYVSIGALHYVALGHGKKRQRKMFADTDLDEFIANQTRKDSPCPSTRTRTVARRSGTSTSKCEVVAFTALQKRRRGAKPKK